MSINDLLGKVKPFYNLLVILVIALIFFALGRLSVMEERKGSIKIEYPEGIQTASVNQAISEINAVTENNSGDDSGQIIGSKNGKKYYFPWCGTVKMIKPENQVIFSSIAEAREAGYLPAANCKGLK